MGSLFLSHLYFTMIAIFGSICALLVNEDIA